MGDDSEMRPFLASDSTSPTIWNLRSKPFFRGETFAPEYLETHRPDLVQQVRGL